MSDRIITRRYRKTSRDKAADTLSLPALGLWTAINAKMRADGSAFLIQQSAGSLADAWKCTLEQLRDWIIEVADAGLVQVSIDQVIKLPKTIQKGRPKKASAPEYMRHKALFPDADVCIFNSRVFRRHNRLDKQALREERLRQIGPCDAHYNRPCDALIEENSQKSSNGKPLPQSSTHDEVESYTEGFSQSTEYVSQSTSKLRPSVVLPPENKNGSPQPGLFTGSDDPEKHPRGKTPAAAPTYPPGFVEFWKTYPARGRDRSSRPRCYELWVKQGLEATWMQVVGVLDLYIDSPDWNDDGGRYIWGADRWLRNRKWAERPAGSNGNGEHA